MNPISKARTGAHLHHFLPEKLKEQSIKGTGLVLGLGHVNLETPKETQRIRKDIKSKWNQSKANEPAENQLENIESGI